MFLNLLFLLELKFLTSIKIDALDFPLWGGNNKLKITKLEQTPLNFIIYFTFNKFNKEGFIKIYVRQSEPKELFDIIEDVDAGLNQIIKSFGLSESLYGLKEESFKEEYSTLKNPSANLSGSLHIIWRTVKPIKTWPSRLGVLSKFLGVF